MGQGQPDPPPTANEIFAAEGLLMLTSTVILTPPSPKVKPAHSIRIIPPRPENQTQDSPTSTLSHVCKECGKHFPTHQALGGHMTAHRPMTAAKHVSGGGTSDQLHECEICHKEFPTGQALGGHKRKHFLEAINSDNIKSRKFSSYGSPSGVKNEGGSPVRERTGLHIDLNEPYVPENDIE